MRLENFLTQWVRILGVRLRAYYFKGLKGIRMNLWKEVDKRSVDCLLIDEGFHFHDMRIDVHSITIRSLIVRDSFSFKTFMKGTD
ncbi:hypothetical protein QQ045_006864 [Rhodiola kirilowii]